MISRDAANSLTHLLVGTKIPRPPHRAGRANRSRELSLGGEQPVKVGINYYYLLQVIYKAKQPVTPDQQVKKVQVD